MSMSNGMLNEHIIQRRTCLIAPYRRMASTTQPECNGTASSGRKVTLGRRNRNRK
jgi:hypothetical protein